jgi:hypothetical protein
MFDALRNLFGLMRPEPVSKPEEPIGPVTDGFEAELLKLISVAPLGNVVSIVTRFGEFRVVPVENRNPITRQNPIPELAKADLIYQAKTARHNLPNDLVEAFQKLADDAGKEGAR